MRMIVQVIQQGIGLWFLSEGNRLLRRAEQYLPVFNQSVAY
jgi:hypothetical protein